MMTTAEHAALIAPGVKKAIADIQSSFPGHQIVTEPDGNGGARIAVEAVSLGAAYTQGDTWIAAHIPVQVPYADVYPLFVRGDLTRIDGRPLGDAMSVGHAFMGRLAVQVSRRSNSRDPTIETPAVKFLKVIEWIRNRP